MPKNELVNVNEPSGKPAPTDHFRNAMSLVENKRWLIKSVMSAMADGLSIQDLEMKIVFMNLFMIERFGNHVGEYCYKVYEKREAICDGCPIQKAFEDGQAHKALRVVRSNGGALRFENNASVLRDENGNIVAGLEVTRIVEARETAAEELLKREIRLAQVQSELQEKNDELETILDHIPGLVFYKDLKNTFIKVNKFLADGHRMNKEAFQGRNLAELYPKAEAEKYYSDDLALIREGKPRLNIEEPWETAHGRVWLSTSKVPIYDENNAPKGILGLSFDITEKKAASEKLKEALTFNETLIANSPYGMALYDEIGQCVRANPAGAEIIGGTVGQLLSQNFHTLPSWKQSGLLQVVERVLKSRQIASHTAELHTSFGKEATLEFRVVPVVLSGRIHILLNFVDVTSFYRIQSDLEDERSELARSNEELEKFAFVASHDLRAPLRAIESLAGWVQDDLGGSIPAESAKHLELLRKRTRRMEALLDDLLKYARVGHVGLPCEKVDTNALVRDIADSLGFNGNFVLSFADLPVFTTARLALTRVFLNLLNNAVKHHDKGRGNISIQVRERDAFYEFSVLDDGPGIPEQFLEKMFDLFQTLKPRDTVEGSGMGLAIVRKIVENIGGSVSLHPVRPRGLEVRFTWPVQPLKKTDELLTGMR